MADKFSIEAKLLVTGVEVKGNLDLGTLKFKVDTSALKKLVQDAGNAAKKVKAKFDNIKLNKLKIDVNKTSLRKVESQIRTAVQNAVKKTKLDLTANVTGGTKTDPFKSQRQAASKSARSLNTLHNLTKQVNSGLRSLVKTLGSVGGRGPGAPAKGNLPFPAGSRTVGVGDLGGGGGGRRPGPAAAPGGGGRGGGGIRDTAAATKTLSDNTAMAAGNMRDLEDLTFEVGKKAAAFRGVAIAINTVVDAAQAAAKFIIEFNDSLIEVNKILQLTDRSLQQLGNDLFALSAKTGVAVDQTIAISEAFARAGLSGRGYGSIAQLTDRALTGLQGTTLDASQTTELFIQVLQQVESGVRGLDKELVTTAKLFDVLGKAEDITASKATDVQAAFKRSAASIFATGVTIEQATALISVLQERTQRGGDVIGTALKTLASRISSSTSEATKALNSIGVATIDEQGNLRNLFEVLQDTAVAFNGLTESEQANVAVKAAGIRQVEVFRAALLDFNRMQNVNNELVNASGDAARKQAAEQSKLANVISRLQIAFQQLVKTASEGIIGEAFVGVITLVEKAVTGIAKLDKMIGGAASTFAGLVTIGLGMKVLIPMVIGIGRAMRFFIGFQKESAAAMGGIATGGKAVATTADGQMVPAMQRVAGATATANTQMQALSASTMFAASQAERLAAANARATLASPAGQAGVAGRAAGNVGRAGVDIVQTGGKAGGAAFLASKKVGILGKTAGFASKAWRGLGKIGLGLASVFTIAGGAVQSFSDGLREEGSRGLGAAADIGGGVLSGAGMGAAIGSFIPVIGTAVGAVVGGLAGAIAPTIRTIDSFSDATKDVGKAFLELGIIQKENGQITSDVAAQIDKAMRNLESFKGLEFRNTDIKDLFDEEGADKRAKERDKQTADALKGLRASFDTAGAAKKQEKAIADAINKLLVARGAGKDIDVGAAEAKFKGSPLFAGLGQKTVDQVESALIEMGNEFGILPEQVKAIVKANLDKLKEAELSDEELAEARVTLKKGIKQFGVLVEEAIPETGGRKQKAVQTELRTALINIAEGQGGELAVAIVKGFAKRAKEGDIEKTVVGRQAGRNAGTLLGQEGSDFILGLLKQAQTRGSELKNLGRETPGASIPGIVKDFQALAKPIVSEDISQRRIEGAVGTQREIEGIVKSLRNEFPLENIEKFIDRPVTKLELALRSFVADFSREVVKLNEAQLRATTPQQELASALAENSIATFEATKRRIALEKADAIQSTRQDFSKLTGAGEKLFQTVDQLRATFKIAGQEIGKNANEELRKAKTTLPDLLKDPKNFQIQGDETKSLVAKIFDVDEATAKEIGEKFGRTTGDAAQSIFGALVKANREIAEKGITDPDQQREIQQSALSPLAEDISALSDEQFKKVSDDALKLTKTLVTLDTEGFQALAKRNSALLSALKARISEEERLLSVSQRRREAAAATARVAVEELTGIRRLVAEREIEARVMQEGIEAQQGFISGLDAQIETLKAVKITDENRATVLERLETLERKRTDVSIKLEEDLAKSRIASIRNTLQASRLAVGEAKKAGDAERRRIGTLADISSLLSVDQSQMAKFNAELETVGNQFKTSQAELAAEAAAVNASLTSQAEKDAQLADIRKRGAAIALEQAKAEAEIIAKRREAVKQVSQELVNNQQEQVEAQKAIIDATKGVAEAFEGYLQAVDGAIMATTRYNLGLEMASITATRVTGGFTGLTDELGAVQDAFRDAENLARQMGASEATLVQIRRESINQQLAMFNQLLNDQTQAARSFFTSSSQDQADLALGVQEAKGVAELLGGSFDAFKSKGADAINDLGAQLLSLPQESRQRIQEAIDLLRTTGGTVGGFTADELQAALDQAIFGIPTEGGPLQVDPIIAVQEKIATLTEEQARLATEELLASQEQVVSAKEQLETAQAAKDLAEIQLERIKEEGEKLRGKLGELRGQLNTTLLQQNQTAKQGFNAVTSAVARAANDVVTKLPDAFSVKVAEAFRAVMTEGGLTVPGAAPSGRPDTGGRQTPIGRGREAVNNRRNQGRNLAEQAQIAAQGGNGTLVPASAADGAPTGRGSNNPNDPSAAQTNRSLQSILDELKTLNTTSNANLTATEEIRDTSGNTVGTANATIAGGEQPEITINVEGTTTVTVTGFEAGVARLATTLAETFGGFVSEEEARRIANEVLENIRSELLRRGIITPNTV